MPNNPDLTGVSYGWFWSTAYGRLTNAQMNHNAQLAMRYLMRNGFTKASAAGIVGNMWAESTMSPGCWEEYGNKTRGYGLVQWTGNVRIPDTDPPEYSGENPYIYWVDYELDLGTAWENNGPLQMARIIYERNNNIEFVGTVEYPGGWSTFQNIGRTNPTASDVMDAASMFLYDYLRPTPQEIQQTEAARRALALSVYNTTRDPIPVWLLFKMARLNRGLIT